MIRLILFALLVFAAWQAKLHYSTLFEREPTQRLVVENRGDAPIERLRVTVAGRTMVRESVAPGASTTFNFSPHRESKFRVVWIWADRTTDYEWTGGYASPNKTSDHTIRIAREHEVFHDAINGSG